ncbi:MULTISPECIES: alpha-ketoglutarate-dependent dioxygenase AlkB [Ramlibacter]|uniref:Alpha-ketoglutarate-dependent dioxygenase AlkB n=1 Tax=Ramlibacter pinisoli TaxID=2682844 RepID=A0A6N8ITN2_9BURK|nr:MULTISPECIES: alpha-ketoglutarate-dependent dioxygenase AlkB [Ramlibacter]MBA2965290.1 alpha-ketoglutarate-dependent dioxygenase AlkB [Ramlibacter sp. CGMCC 1.13660]MVQ30254.1 alpha-ketoglutarate-dependent dioxygenase AlkB [Ramlibacter pinisoli]
MSPLNPQQHDLFGTAAVLPDGLRYETAFLDAGEEAALLGHIAALPLAPMRYRGYTALRRTVSYGGSYDFSAGRLEPAEPIAPWLMPLRDKAAAWLGVTPSAFTQALVAEYRPGTPLGWHRDVPDFEDVVGISLGAQAVLRFRPYPPREPKRADVIRLVLEPRSIYLLRGPARWAWQHSVAPTRALRHSITFLTARAAPLTS